MLPWNDWYHIMTHTYGTWLPGDPKGFRTRHHRQHVDGDYKNPPPAGRDAARWEQAKRLMKREPVYLTPAQQARAVVEIVRSFQKRSIELKALSIDAIHMHALARVTDRNPRHHMGVAKRECAHYMKVDGLAPIGGLWGVRCDCVPIADGRHFENVVGYVLDHALHGAVIWPAPTGTVVMNNPMENFDPDLMLLD